MSFVSQKAFGEDTSASRYRLFSDVGIGFRSGGAFIEKPEGRAFDARLLLGAEADTTILTVDNAHNIIIPLSYNRILPRERSGSEQFDVDTLYQIVDVGIEYDFNWSFFSMGLAAGASMMIVSTRMRLYDVSDPQVDTGNLLDPLDDAYEFPNRSVLETEKNVGLEVGPLFNLEFGFDVGRVFGGIERFFEVRGAFQYVRRDTRNEMYTWLTLQVHPMAYLEP